MAIRIDFTSRYKKRYRLLTSKLQDKVDERIALFVQDQFSPVLENHALHGEYADLRSINITGDYRALYETLSQNSVRFVRLGTHAELYGK